MLNQNGIQVGTGYSGHGEGLNNPAYCNVRDVGPLPIGNYQIGPAEDNPDVGLYAMFLAPDRSNEMFGRSGFFIHGDNPQLNHTASDGCIVLPNPVRRDINESSDRELVVTA